MQPFGQISVDPERRDGRAGLRDTVFTVSAVLKMLAREGSIDQVVQRVPDLNAADVQACLQYAAERVDHPVPVAVPLGLKVTLSILLALCILFLWVLGSPGAPLWVVALVSLATAFSVWSVVSLRYPIHARRSRRT